MYYQEVKSKHSAQQLITWPKNLVFGQVLFSSACMCLCVCVCVCESVYQLSQKVLDRFWWNLVGWLLMTKDRFLLKMSFIRTEVTENPYLYFYLLRPFDDFFRGYFPFFIIREVKCNKLAKKHLRLLNGEGQVCVLLNTLNSSFIFTIHHIKSLLLPYTWVIPKVLHESS